MSDKLDYTMIVPSVALFSITPMHFITQVKGRNHSDVVSDSHHSTLFLEKKSEY